MNVFPACASNVPGAHRDGCVLETKAGSSGRITEPSLQPHLFLMIGFLYFVFGISQEHLMNINFFLLLFCFILFFICMYVLRACTSVYHVHSWFSQRPKEGIVSLGTEDADGCELWVLRIESLISGRVATLNY